MIAISAGYRLAGDGIWVASSLVTGGFWFARNLVNAGNPLPWIDKGPLPGPDQLDINIRHPANVAHYLLPPDGGVIRHHLIPGLHDSFGDLWPLVLVARDRRFPLGDLPRPHARDSDARGSSLCSVVSPTW